MCNFVEANIAVMTGSKLHMRLCIADEIVYGVMILLTQNVSLLHECNSDGETGLYSWNRFPY